MQVLQISEFHCPRWNELPEKTVFNREAVNLVNEALSQLLSEEDKLTSTMVQNYVKWGILPTEAGRKYSRTRIAYLIVITIYKQVLTLSNVKKGVELLLKHMDIELAYNEFCQAVENALAINFKPILESESGKVEFKQSLLKEISYDKIGLYAVAYSFASKLLGNIIIQADGFNNLGE